jgi:hypothetical protein
MKNKLFILIAVMLVAAMVFPVPAYAYTGVQGRVIDSKTKTAWQNGGDIWVINNSTGDIEATGKLDSAGAFSINWGDDALNYGMVGTVNADSTPPLTGENVEFVIDFGCAFSLTPGCPPVNGTPAMISFAFTQNGIPIRFNAGTNIETGTGPTALELVDFSVTPQSSNNTWLPFVLLIGSVALVSGAVTVIRKRRA